MRCSRAWGRRRPSTRSRGSASPTPRDRRRRPDVIVLDLRMPGMGGAELCRRLRADERTQAIPIVLLTGADPEEARRAQRAGAAALVRKPFSPLDLLAVVERVSGRAPVPRKPRRV